MPMTNSNMPLRKDRAKRSRNKTKMCAVGKQVAGGIFYLMIISQCPAIFGFPITPDDPMDYQNSPNHLLAWQVK